MLNNASFYPTPAAVADAMLADIDRERLESASILEPSAGKGDLADAAVRAIYRPYRRGFWGSENSVRERIHCVEMDVELQATLRGKGYTVVGTDFLGFRPDERYDLILMNPPFADGVKHLLHAWDILEHGEIRCLLNAQNLQNLCTAERRLLAGIIEEHGSTTDLGSCFAKAERRTDVPVTLVKLRKEAESAAFSFEAGPDSDPYASFDDGTLFDNEIATRDLIGNLVTDYDRARELFLEVSSKLMELGHYALRFQRSEFSSDMSEAFTNAAKNLLNAKTAKQQEAAYNTFVRGLKREAWGTVFRLTKFSSLVSQGVAKELQNLQEQNSRMAFSRANIMGLLDTLINSRESIMQQCVLDAFDTMTRYHKENRIHVEGWLTNDAWKVNQRIVLPNCINWLFGSPRLNYSKHDELCDIDRALASLEGKSLSGVPVPITAAIDEHCRKQGANLSGMPFESTYFEMHGYKKGTLHLHFLDKTLWERFNLAAAQGKNWLPEDYKARRREEAARNRRAEQCGLPMGV